MGVLFIRGEIGAQLFLFRHSQAVPKRNWCRCSGTVEGRQNRSLNKNDWEKGSFRESRAEKKSDISQKALKAKRIE
jgi:hypothetical protein